MSKHSSLVITITGMAAVTMSMGWMLIDRLDFDEWKATRENTGPSTMECSAQSNGTEAISMPSHEATAAQPVFGHVRRQAHAVAEAAGMDVHMPLDRVRQLLHKVRARQ